MPVGEYIDYVNLINKQREEQENDIDTAISGDIEDDINDIKFAANSLPGGFI